MQIRERQQTARLRRPEAAPSVASTRYYPVFIDLKGQAAVVFGGGPLAAEKAAGLAGAGARVTVFTAAPGPELSELVASGSVGLVPRDPRAGDLAGARIAIDASDDATINRRSWAEAERLGVLINVVDRPAQCRFIAPAVVRRGPLQIAISTSGESPYLASALRRRLELLLGEEWGPFVKLVGAIRRRLRAGGVSIAEQTPVYRRLLGSPVRRLLREQRPDAARLVADSIADGSGRTGRPSQVSIVGAGPGDAGLLTLMAQEVLAEAEWVFHDALVSPDVLSLCPPSARLVDVGKRGGRRSPGQREITTRVIAAARAGKQVVRLKGGDPFVFGRGGEELKELTEAGLEVLVVPGVSAAVAAPGAAGIPLTLRGVASSVGFITATDRGGAIPERLEALSASADTLVVLMPLTNLGQVISRIAGVTGADKPAALISDATTRDQLVVRSSLGSLEAAAAAAGIRAPATLVVGEVVRSALPTRAAPPGA